MSTPANPQHLLRRPKKPQPKRFDVRIVAVGAVIAVVAGGAIAGFSVFGHGKSAAVPPAPAQTEAASLALAQTVAPPIATLSLAKHKTHKISTTEPAASPSPDASQTPAPTPSAQATAASTRATQPATSNAHAKHEAALRLEAARHAAQVLAVQSASVPSSVVSAPNTPAPALVPPPTSAPAPATATPDAEPTPVYAPTIVVDARFVDRVTPVYPDIAREQGVQGTAIVLATIGPDGRVLSVAVDQSTGNRQLDNAAVAAARASRFAPPEIDGKPATETYRIVYTFDPNG